MLSSTLIPRPIPNFVLFSDTLTRCGTQVKNTTQLTQLATASFDEIIDLTAEMSFYFASINTALSNEINRLGAKVAVIVPLQKR